MRIRALKALRPPPLTAARVSAPPFDSLSTAEARQLARGNPLSFLHVSHPEINLPDNTGPRSDEIYAGAKEYFDKLRKEEHLVRDGEPAVYIYEQHWKCLVQRGFVVLCHVDDYEKNVIKKHARTSVLKEMDRLHHDLAIGAVSGLVQLAFRDDPETDNLLGDLSDGKPLYDFTDEQQVRHLAWRITGSVVGDVVAALAKVPAAYITDGHHRAANSWHAAQKYRGANPHHTGNETYNWFPVCLLPASSLRILPYNCVVKELNGLSPDQFLKRLRQVCKVTVGASPEPKFARHVSLYLDGGWHGLAFDEPTGKNPVAQLDASILYDRVLAPILGIRDLRNPAKIDYVGGIHGTSKLMKLVDAHPTAAAFSMHPITLEQIMDIADAGQVMPHKSTWFEPKPRAGLFVHCY